ESGIELASGSGWRGEFLAAAFYSSGAAVLPVLSGEEIRRWAALGAAVQVGRELGQGFFQRLPDGFPALSAAERAIVFELCAAAVPRTPRAAASLFAGFPRELTRISSGRLPLLRALVPAAVDGEAVLGLLPLLEAIVRTIPEGARRAILERVAESGARLPLCVVPLLRSLPRALEHVGAQLLPRWIERGEAIAEANPDAGRAYFALESRTALRFLQENSAAVHLQEPQAVLRAFARMLSGQSLTLRGGDGASLRAFLDRESLERTSFALPDNVDFFDSWEDNFAILKLATAGGVGRLLYGT